MKCVILIAIILVAAVAARKGAYEKSCKDMKLNAGHMLEGQCKTKTGKFVPTKLDLNSCLGNIDGVLKHGHQDYAKSCSGFKMAGHEMSAQCKNKTGKPLAAKMNLSANISNLDGHLTCDKVKKAFFQWSIKGAFKKAVKSAKKVHGAVLKKLQDECKKHKKEINKVSFAKAGCAKLLKQKK